MLFFTLDAADSISMIIYPIFTTQYFSTYHGRKQHDTAHFQVSKLNLDLPSQLDFGFEGKEVKYVRDSMVVQNEYS